MFADAHEPMIGRDTWEGMQKLREATAAGSFPGICHAEGGSGTAFRRIHGAKGEDRLIREAWFCSDIWIDLAEEKCKSTAS